MQSEEAKAFPMRGNRWNGALCEVLCVEIFDLF